MIVLAFDCASGQCAVSLRLGDGCAVTRIETRQRGQAESLVPMIGTVLKEAEVSYAAIGRVAVTTGPGSFTGVRVGLAAAQGLGLALDVPVIGIDSFTAFAASMDTAMRRAIVIESRRSEAYWRLMNEDGPGKCETPDRIALQLPDGPLTIGGDAAALLTDRGNGWDIKPCLPGPDTTALAQIALEADPALYLPLPVYIRPPDAIPA